MMNDLRRQFAIMLSLVALFPGYISASAQGLPSRLLGGRVTVELPSSWRPNNGAPTETDEEIYLVIDSPAGNKAELNGYVAVFAQRRPRDIAIDEMIRYWLGRLNMHGDATIVSEIDDGADWRTLVLKSKNPGRLIFGRIGVHKDASVAMFVAIPDDSQGDEVWVRARVQEFNSASTSLAIDGMNEFKVELPLDLHRAPN